jgi:hypothetical protein
MGRRKRLRTSKTSTQKKLDNGRQSSRHKSSVLYLRTRRPEFYSFNEGREDRPNTRKSPCRNTSVTFALFCHFCS